MPVADTTDPQGEGDTRFYIPRHESENTFREAITLNYEADTPKDTGITAEEEDVLEDNRRDHIYGIPIAGDNVPKGNSLAAKHYFLNSDAYNSNRIKGTPKITIEQLEFENPTSSYMAEVSKPPLGKFTPEFQGKMMMIQQSNSGAEHNAFFGGDILPLMMKENVPKGYIFLPERRSTLTTPDFRIPMKDNINFALERTVLLDKGTFSKNYATYTDEQTDPWADKDQTATGSITNSPTGVIPVTYSLPVSSEEINVENYYPVSGIGTPLSLEYTNTLRDDSFSLRPGTTLAKENNLDAMDLIISEPDQSDSEYISNKPGFELKKKENSPIKNLFNLHMDPMGLYLIHPPLKMRSPRVFCIG